MDQYQLYVYGVENTLYNPLSEKKYINAKYPFNTKVIHNLSSFELESSITILCGDNGCGKSTLLKGIAEQLGAYRITNSSGQNNSNYDALGQFTFLKLKTRKRAKKNFFFSGEDFIKYIDWLEKTKEESQVALEEIDERYGDTYAGMLARQPHEHTLYDIKSMYGESLATKSHGEGFISFFKSRIIDNGLYILDEPESALSYENQYLLAVLIRDAVKRGCQFIIATHSPVITAIPEASLFEIYDGKISKITYDALENIQFLNMFVRRRQYLFEYDNE